MDNSLFVAQAIIGIKKYSHSKFRRSSFGKGLLIGGRSLRLPSNMKQSAA